MRATSAFNFDAGTSTRWCLAAAALRMRVRKSPMGSVCIVLLLLLPTRLYDAGNFSLERHTAEADAAHLKLADISAGAAAYTATVARAHLELGLLESFCDFGGACHLLLSPWSAQRKAQALEQFAAFFIIARGGGKRDVHSLDLVDAGVIDLRKHQLIL